uniref:PE family protein n=1 Tax=Mycobacterium sp. HUMS_1102779 TaxID=3383487 RepID=UPI00389B3174
MSFVVAAPDAVAAAAQNLASIHSTLSQASATIVGPTTGVVAAAQDEVSASVAQLFGAFGQEYQEISAQTQAFHQQFVNLLSSGATAYAATEAANVQQTLTAAVNAPANTLLAVQSGAAAAAQNAGQGAVANAAASANSLVAPYESLLANTNANLQSIGTTWTSVTEPALMQTFTTQFGSPQQILTAVESGNLQPLLAIPARLALGTANVLGDVADPISVTVTSLTQTNASLAIGVGLPELLAFDALGAPVNAALAMQSSTTAFFGALQAGNPVGAFTTLVGAPANIANAFLNGEVTLPVGLPLAGVPAVADIPFSGLLAPLQPFSTTATLPGSSLLQTVTISGPPVGGLIPALAEYTPQLLATAFES